MLAAAYGVPCAVSDELVMVALKLRDGARFDPKAFFDFCERQVTGGSMDRKWFPDFIRVIDEFEYTRHREDPGAEPEAGALLPPPPADGAALLADARHDQLPALHGRGLRRPAHDLREGRAVGAPRPVTFWFRALVVVTALGVPLYAWAAAAASTASSPP